MPAALRYTYARMHMQGCIPVSAGLVFAAWLCCLQAGKEAQRAADVAAAIGHSKLLALQQKQEGVAADMHAAVQQQERWRAQWEAQKQALQQEHDDLQQSIQVSGHAHWSPPWTATCPVSLSSSPMYHQASQKGVVLLNIEWLAAACWCSLCPARSFIGACAYD